MKKRIILANATRLCEDKGRKRYAGGAMDQQLILRMKIIACAEIKHPACPPYSME